MRRDVVVGKAGVECVVRKRPLALAVKLDDAIFQLMNNELFNDILSPCTTCNVTWEKQ